MCGIFGVITKNNTEGSKMQEIAISRRIKILEHLKLRGPNSSSMFGDTKCYLLCCQLNVCDSDEKFSLKESTEQTSETIFTSGDVVLAYDGQISNNIELRKHLIAEGKHFITYSDSELIVKCYEFYGSEFVERLTGQFAFCLYDTKRKEVYLYRDRFGIKPLYYYESNDYIIFSSSINAIRECFDIKPTILQSSIVTYLSFGNVLGEKTFYENIKKLEPGHYILIHKHIATIFNYWDLNQSNVNAYPDIYESMSHLETKLMSAFVRNTPQSEKINIFLSGGLDSSTIVYYVKKLIETGIIHTKEIHTYSIGFDSENEFAYASLVAEKFQTYHENIITNTDEYIESMIDLISFKGAPLNTPNEPLTYIMSKKITSTDAGNIVLSGEGVDELLHGYGQLFISHYNYLNDTSIPFYKYFVDKYSHAHHYLPHEYKQKLFKSSVIPLVDNSDENNSKLFDECFAKCDDLHYQDKIGYAMIKLHLPCLLDVLDNASMFASIESRVPFLDHDFVEYCFNRVYREHKIMMLKDIKLTDLMDKKPEDISEKFDSPKYILKQLMNTKLPLDVISRKRSNFNVPINLILSEKYEIITQILTEGSIHHLGLFELEELKQRFESQSCDATVVSRDQYDVFALWLLLNLEIFTQLFVDMKQISDVKTFFHVDPLFKYEKDKLLERIILPYDVQLQRYIKFYIVKTLFEKFNIEYFAYDSTMLGCVRHRGFIPWDDSINIMIMEEQCAKITGDFLMELLYAGFQIKKSSSGYQIFDFLDTSCDFLVNIYTAQFMDTENTYINFSSQQLIDDLPNRQIAVQDLYPLVQYQFGFYNIYGIKDPIKYFEQCGFGNYMHCAIIKQLHNRENNDVLQAFLSKYSMSSLIIRDISLITHVDKVIYTDDWKHFFNRTKNFIPNDFNPTNYKLLNGALSNLDTMELYVHYIMHGRFDKLLYNIDTVLPPDFDVKGYRCLNPDIANLSDHMLRVHYVTAGKNTNRKYNIRSLLPYDFVPETYKYLNSELADMTEDQLISHYINIGCNAKLYYKTEGVLPDDFDPKKYMRINKNLKLTSDQAAVIHYINIGRKESRKYK